MAVLYDRYYCTLRRGFGVADHVKTAPVLKAVTIKHCDKSVREVARLVKGEWEELRAWKGLSTLDRFEMSKLREEVDLQIAEKAERKRKRDACKSKEMKNET